MPSAVFDPTFVAALGNLYSSRGERKRRQQYALVEQIGHLNAVNGALAANLRSFMLTTT